MSYFIRIFCESDAPVIRRELAEFIKEGAYFVDPSFSPPPESNEALQPRWQSFVVYYHPGKRPIVFQRLDGDCASMETRELADRISSLAAGDPAHLILTKLQKVKQVFVIELDPVGLTEGAWLMLDCIEAFLARSCGGLIYAPDDGVFDADLRKLL
jgi:hypothetical protein